MKNIRHLCITLVLMAFLCPKAYPFSVKALNLKQLTLLSERIFRGKVLEITSDNDQYESGHLVRYTSFRVDDCLKGDCGTQITIKQVAGRGGPPEYGQGEDYLLFLPGDSEKTGLVAPVGIWQGVYQLRQKNGKWVLPKRAQSASIFKGLKSAKVSSSSEMDYDSFKEAILEIVKGGE